MKNDFEQDLEINPNELDVQASMQAEIYFKWAEKAVKARERLDRAKFQLEVSQATLSSQARVDPDSFGITKVTKTGLDAAVKSHPDYVEAYEEYLKAKSSSALMDKAADAMEQKKRMIEVLITLHGQQYFAGPSVPRNLSEAWKEAKEKTSARVLEKQKAKIRTRIKRKESDG